MKFLTSILFPGYLQKVLFHQRSGSNTPLGFESGQLSPITVNVQTPSRFSMAPGSPALLSPPPGLIADRPPGFTALPRDELTVWTGADDRSEADGEDSGGDSRQGRREDGGVDRCEDSREKGVDGAGGAAVQHQGLLVTDSFSSVSSESLVSPGRSSSPVPVCAVSVSLSEVGWGAAPAFLSSYSCALLPCSFCAASALPSVHYTSSSSVLSPIPASLCPPFPHCRVGLSPSPQSPLFPTPPLGSPGDLKSTESSVEKEESLSCAEVESTPPSVSAATRPLRPLQIPKLVLPECPPSAFALSPMGPYSPISPASARSSHQRSPMSPADAHLLGPWSPISPASRSPQDPYSPITPVSLPPLGPYSPISPATLPSLGPYSPISPAADAVPVGLASSLAPSFTGAPSWPMFASSQFLSVGSRPISSSWTFERLPCTSWEGNAPLLSMAGNSGGESNIELLASGAGTSKLLVVVQWLCFLVWCQCCRPPPPATCTSCTRLDRERKMKEKTAVCAERWARVVTGLPCLLPDWFQLFHLAACSLCHQ